MPPSKYTNQEKLAEIIARQGKLSIMEFIENMDSELNSDKISDELIKEGLPTIKLFVRTFNDELTDEYYKSKYVK